MVTVEDAADVPAIMAASLEELLGGASNAPAPATSAPAASAPTATAASPASPAPAATVAADTSSGRVFASPFARKVASEKNVDINNVVGSGPNNRVVAADVLEGRLKAQPAAVSSISASVPAVGAASAVAAPVSVAIPAVNAGVYQDFTMSASHLALAARFTHAKQVVPHYYLSMELNLSKLLKLRGELNENNSSNKSDIQISVLDLLVKAASAAIKQVPDVNSAWMDSFIRKYDQVSMNKKE